MGLRVCANPIGVQPSDASIIKTNKFIFRAPPFKQNNNFKFSASPVTSDSSNPSAAGRGKPAPDDENL
jgi:hypothetical protein